MNPSDTSNSLPIFTPSLTLENGWYPPSADDIGHIIRVKCKDKHDLGVLRCIDSQPIPVDEDLAAKVEEAVTKDRILAKIIVCSSELHFSRLRTQSTANKGTPPRNHKSLTRSGSNASNCSTGSLNGSSRTTDMVDTSHHSLGNGKSGSQYHVADIPDFEVAGSIEVGSKGILICEKGVECGGLRFYPSSQMEVTCCQAASLVLRVPLVEVSGAGNVTTSITTGGTSASSDQDNGSVIATSSTHRLVEWVGSEDGEMFDSLCDVLTEVGGHSGGHGTDSSPCDNSAHALDPEDSTHSGGSMSSRSCDDIQRKPCQTQGGKGDTKPVQVLELVISCRDRLIRDSIVLGLRAMVMYDPVEAGPVDGAFKVRRGLSRLPWHQADYAGRCSDVEGRNMEGDDISKEQLRLDVDRLQGEVLAACAAREEMRVSLEQALAGKEEAEGRVLNLQQELSLLRQGEGPGEGEGVGGKSVAQMTSDMADLQEVCRGLQSKLQDAEVTIAELTALVSSPQPRQPKPTAANIPKNDSFVSSASTPEPSMQGAVVFPVYEASSGEMVLPMSPLESKASTPGSPMSRASSEQSISGGPDCEGATHGMEGCVARLASKLQELRDCVDISDAGEKGGDATDRVAQKDRIIHDIEELVGGVVRLSDNMQAVRGHAGVCSQCIESGTSNSTYDVANDALSSSGMDESKYSCRQEGGRERQRASDKSRSVDLLSPLVAISSSLKVLLTTLSTTGNVVTTGAADISMDAAGGTSKERSDSDVSTEGATDGNYSDCEDTTDASGSTSARTLRVIEVIQSQVEQLCKTPLPSVSNRIAYGTPTTPTSPLTPRSCRGVAGRKKRATAGETSTKKHGQDEDEEEEVLDGDEGFASVNLVTLEGAPLDDNEVCVCMYVCMVD